MKKKILFLSLSVTLLFSLLSFSFAGIYDQIQPLKDEDLLGPDFEIWGQTETDISPFINYILLLKENGIIMKLPDLSISKMHPEYDWIYTEIGSKKDIYILYVYYMDGSKDRMLVMYPDNYKPQDEAITILIMSMMNVDRKKADEIYENLQYNVIDGNSDISYDNLMLMYSEYNNNNNGFKSLAIERVLDPVIE